MLKCSQPSRAVSPHLPAEMSTSAATIVSTSPGLLDRNGGVDRVLPVLQTGFGAVGEPIKKQSTSPHGVVSVPLDLEGVFLPPLLGPAFGISSMCLSTARRYETGLSLCQVSPCSK